MSQIMKQDNLRNSRAIQIFIDLSSHIEVKKSEQLSEKESQLYKKIIQRYTETPEELQDYLSMSLDKKLQIINEYFLLKESVREATSKQTVSPSSEKKIRRGTMINVDTHQDSKISPQDMEIYEKVAKSLAKSDEQMRELMNRTVEEKIKLIRAYNSIHKSIETEKEDGEGSNAPSTPVGPKTLDLSNTNKKGFFKKLFSSTEPSDESPSSTSRSSLSMGLGRSSWTLGRKEILKDLDLTEEEEKVFGLHSNILSDGDQDRFELYQNMSNEQKHELLKHYQDEAKKLEARYNANISKLPFDRNYKGYKINFQSVFTVMDIQLAFYNHLIHECNTEQFDFLLMINRMENAVTERNISYFYHLINEFIKDGAPRQINISGPVRQQFLKKLEYELKSKHVKDQLWAYSETPREVLEDIRAALIVDLKVDVFPRFTASLEGFRAIARNFHNPSVISLQPKHAVRYKLEKSFLGIKKIDLDELSIILSDPKSLLQRYMSTEWTQTLEFETQVNKQFNKLGTTNDPQTDFERKFLVNKKFSRTNIKIKIVIMNQDKRKMLQKNAATYFCPILEFINPSTDWASVQTALMIGPWLFQWDEDELCIPKRCLTTTTLMSLDFDQIDTLNNFDENILNVAKVICDWNVHKDYKKVGSNSQDFIEAILVAIGSKTLQSNGPLFDLLKRIKTHGNSLLTLKVDKTFCDTFKLSQDTFTFDTHVSLDDFYKKLIEIDPMFDENHRQEFWMLKSFDRAFWMKHLYHKRELDLIKPQIETLERDLAFKEMRNESDPVTELMQSELASLQEKLKKLSERDAPNTPGHDEKCCPFGNPINTNSIMF